MTSWTPFGTLLRVRSAAPVFALGALALFLVFAGRGRSQAVAVGAREARAIQGAGEGAPADTTDGAAGEDGAAATRLPPPQELAKLTYQREFFDYDAADRRDPFRPLLDVDADVEGPRFDELELTGIFAEEGGEDMAVVEDSRRKGYFLKRGDLVGKATLVDIGPGEATFEVRDYGISRREILKLQRPEETP